MNKPEVIEALSDATDYSKTLCKEMYEALESVLRVELIDTGATKLFNLGTLSVKTLGKRRGRNPRTGEEITVGPTNVVRFKASVGIRKDIQPKKKRRGRPPKKASKRVG